MKIFLAYGVAVVLSLLNGKLVAGAISGILLTPLVKPVERFGWISTYLVPILQGVAMGSVAVLTAVWILSWFSIELGWSMVVIILISFLVIATILMQNREERSFHLYAGLGELLGILLAGYYFIQITI
jgi:ABC-type transport system involved in cytochrome bd biosynthesis fused ATPase/permease subunit